MAKAPMVTQFEPTSNHRWAVKIWHLFYHQMTGTISKLDITYLLWKYSRIQSLIRASPIVPLLALACIFSNACTFVNIFNASTGTACITWPYFPLSSTFCVVFMNLSLRPSLCTVFFHSAVFSIWQDFPQASRFSMDIYVVPSLDFEVEIKLKRITKIPYRIPYRIPYKIHCKSHSTIQNPL